MEEIIIKILYGNIDKEPWDCIKEHCQLNGLGNIDPEWVNSLNEEQLIRLNIAATLKKMWSKNEYNDLD